MTTSQKITNFVKQVKARLNQDDNELIVLKNQRKADSVLNSQIAALKNREIDLETEVEEAEERLEEAKYPVTIISDGKNYLENIVNSENELKQAKTNLSDLRESIEFFKKLQEENNRIVEE